MKIKSLFIIIFNMVLISCVNQNGGTSKKNDSKRLSIELEEVKIPIDSSYLHNYPIYNSLIQDGKDYFIGYNKYKHSFDIFNITDREIYGKIILFSDGVDEVKFLGSFVAKSLDSLYVNTYKKLLLLNKEGRVVRKYDLDLRNKFINNNVTVVSNKTSKMVLNKNFIYMPLRVFNKKNKSNFDFPCAISLDLSSGTIDTINIHYPKLYRDQDKDFFPKYYPTIAILNDSIIYNYASESKIYLYGRQYDSLINANSIFSKNTSTYVHGHGLQIDKKNHMENPYFSNLLYYPNKNEIYRLHVKEMEYRKKNNEFTAFGERDTYLMVFDDKWNIKGEIILPSQTYITISAFVCSEGLFVNKAHYQNPQLNEDFLIFDNIKTRFHE